MAEARVAVEFGQQDRRAVAFQADDDGAYRITVVVPNLSRSLRIVSKFLRLTATRIFDLLYPSGPIAFALTAVLVAYLTTTAGKESWLRSGWLAQLLWDLDLTLLPFTNDLSIEVRVAYLATAASFGGFIILMMGQRFLLRCLLNYHGWLYAPPKVTYISTKIWGGLVLLLRGLTQQYMYTNEGCLPYLPVPSVRSTVDKFMESVRPLLSEEELAKMEEQKERFLSKESWRLQLLLFLKQKLWAPNYVTDWWEKYVYLRGNGELPINSNYYVLDSGFFCPTSRQTSRMAQVFFLMMQFKHKIEAERLPPQLIRGIVPLAMTQYVRMFNTTRIPSAEGDELRHYEGFEVRPHAAVLRRGFIYRLDYVNAQGSLLTPVELQHQLDRIKADADSRWEEVRGRSGADGRATSARLCIPALTAQKRDVWASYRLRHFQRGTLNATSLEVIESACAFLVLDDKSYEVSDWIGRGRSLFHGNGANRWFDKSINLVVHEDGTCGLNCEHSWADAPVMAHCFEWVLLHDTFIGYDDKGRVLPVTEMKPRMQDFSFSRSQLSRDAEHTKALAPSSLKALPIPRLLSWDLSGPAVDDILKAVEEARSRNAEVDLHIGVHDAYGKGVIKKMKVSPDAWIQLAFQLAYLRDQGSFGLTYEASMTRLFRDGRTETVRSATTATAAFARRADALMKRREAGEIVESVEWSECVELARTATNKHVTLYKDAMTGRGIDRHLFALRVAAYALGVDSDFLTSVFGMQWKLSTSQQPQGQEPKMWKMLDKKSGEFERQWSPGGGFGPVADDGYGVSYMVAGEQQLFFHVSSHKDAKNTDSKRFLSNIKQALIDVKDIFEAASA